MGLDMYLYAHKFVGGGYDHYRYNYIHEEGKPVRIEPKTKAELPAEAKQFDRLLSVAGMGSFEKFHERYPEGNSITIQLAVGYWRKANAIHRWFVENVQEGVDNCKEYYVSRDQLQSLLDTVTIVLGTADKGDPTTEKDVLGNEYESYPHATLDVELAKQELGSQAGFFFGSTEYDQWYILDLESTRDQITAILGDKRLEGWDFYYQSSW